MVQKSLAGLVPVIFQNREEFEAWRDQLRRAAELPNAQIEVVGSASTGFSLAPGKFGRPFSRVATDKRPASDLDVAVVDQDLFLDTWGVLVREDRAFRLSMTPDEKDKLLQDVYYGFISEKVTPRRSKPFSTMLALRAESGKHAISSGLKFNLRIYRRSEDLVGYQVASLRASQKIVKGQ